MLTNAKSMLRKSIYIYTVRSAWAGLSRKVSLCRLSTSILVWCQRCCGSPAFRSGKQDRKELHEKQHEQTHCPPSSWGFGGLGNWGAMAFPCFLLPASDVTSLHPHITIPISYTGQVNQPQTLAHEAATLLDWGQIWGMESGRDYLYQESQEHNSLWFLWQPRFT